MSVSCVSPWTVPANQHGLVLLFFIHLRDRCLLRGTGVVSDMLTLRLSGACEGTHISTWVKYSCIELNLSTNTECDYLYGWNKKATFANISPTTVNPRDKAGYTEEEEELDWTETVYHSHCHIEGHNTFAELTLPQESSQDWSWLKWTSVTQPAWPWDSKHKFKRHIHDNES